MLIIGRKHGRLGNRIFTFAHFIANAIEYKYTVFNPAFDEYARYFKGTDSQLLNLYPPDSTQGKVVFKRFWRRVLHTIVYYIVYPMVKKLLPLTSNKYYQVLSLKYPEVYDWQNSGFLRFVHEKIVICNGWVFWDHSNLKKHADKVREYFRLTDFYSERVKGIMKETRKGADIIIGVHIRQGDYARWLGGKYYFSLEQYAQIIKNVQILFEDKKVKFLIISNNKDNSDYFKDSQYCFGSGHFIEDMYSLAACDYIIGPPSTFSGWASFYGDVLLYCIENPDRAVHTEDFKMFDMVEHLGR